ncbi:hypothetical protein EKD04_021295 [Chloroflexales bacterium ZM16-3]|nr:hypothetical protein [Chloroflexales bacterium ZM16-3]
MAFALLAGGCGAADARREPTSSPHIQGTAEVDTAAATVATSTVAPVAAMVATSTVAPTAAMVATSTVAPAAAMVATSTVAPDVTEPTVVAHDPTVAVITPAATLIPQMPDGWAPLSAEEQQFVQGVTDGHAALTTAVEELRIFLSYGGQDDADVRRRTLMTVDDLQGAIMSLRAFPLSERFGEAWQPYLVLLDDLDGIGTSVREALPESGGPIPPLLERAGIRLEMLVGQLQSAGEAITALGRMPFAADPSGLTYSFDGLQIHADVNSGTSTTIGAAPPTGSIDGPGATRIWVEEETPTNFEEQHPFRLFKANLDGSEQRLLLSSDTFYDMADRLTQMPYNFAPSRLTLSADGTQLLFHAGSCCSPSTGFSSFFALDLATGDLLWSRYDGVNIPGWIAPDAGRALVGGMTIDSEGYRTSTYFLVGGAVDVDLGNAISALSWLADGRILVARGNQVVILKADGSDDRVLADLSANAYISEMALAPDQQMVAFLARDGTPESGAALNLWVVAMMGGGDPQRLAEVPADASDLGWR